MKPPSFEYFDPRTPDEVLEHLQQHGYDAKVLAGGQSLIPLLNFRMARPQVLVDLNRVEGMDYVRETDGGLAIGAMTRQRTLEDSKLVHDHCGLLTETMALIGHPQIRNRGTVGGSLVHADPAAELPAVAKALDAQLKVRGKDGERTVAAEEFFVSVYTSDVEPTEMLVEVEFPKLDPSAGWAFEEFAVRHGDYALAGVAAVVTLDDDQTCSEVRLSAIAVGETAFRDPQIEEILKGEKLTDTILEEVAARLSSAIDPFEDLHASAPQRRHLAGVLAKRALQKAAARAAAAKK